MAVSGKKIGCEVDPFLIGEHALAPISPAEGTATIAPPPEKGPAFPAVVDAEEAEVEDAVTQAAQLVIEDRVGLGFGVEQVRSEHHAGRAKLIHQIVERREDDDVGVEVEQQITIVASQQFERRLRFDRRCELDQVVLEQPAGIARGGEVIDEHDAIDGVVVALADGTVVAPVDDQPVNRHLGTVLAQRLAQRACFAGVVRTRRG